MPSSLAILLPPALGFSPHPPVSVYGTGPWHTIAAFPGRHSWHFATLMFAPLHATAPMHRGFSSCAAAALAPVFPFPACLLCPRPHISDATGYRNFNLLSIGYASQPRLRPRLTQGRQALPWKPWIFGQQDSHLFLATHSGILSPCRSTAPCGTASPQHGCSPTNHIYIQFHGFGAVFQPRTFSAQGLSASELLRTL